MAAPVSLSALFYNQCYVQLCNDVIKEFDLSNLKDDQGTSCSLEFIAMRLGEEDGQAKVLSKRKVSLIDLKNYSQETIDRSINNLVNQSLSELDLLDQQFPSTKKSWIFYVRLDLFKNKEVLGASHKVFCTLSPENNRRLTKQDVLDYVHRTRQIYQEKLKARSSL